MISLSPVVVDRWIRRVFLDLDGVVVDFDGYMREHGLTGDEVKRQVGAYLRMRPMPGALEAIDSLTGMGFELFIATKPPTGVAHAYADKAAWVFEHLPRLRRNLILTHDKGLLGDECDALVDDRPHKANCTAFKGVLLPFGGEVGWPEVLAALSPRSPQARRRQRGGNEGVPGIAGRAGGEKNPGELGCLEHAQCSTER